MDPHLYTRVKFVHGTNNSRLLSLKQSLVNPWILINHYELKVHSLED